MKKIIPIILITILLLVIATQKPHSIPAFARKYRMTCKTCHSPFPKLTDYGEDFAGNGFRLPDKEAPRYFVDTGDESLSLIRDFPIAFRLEGYFQYFDYTDYDKPDIATPYLFKILSGGEITEGIGYYAYFYFDERGEVAGIDDAFIVFNNLFGADLDLYVGQFAISDPLFKSELRLTREGYSIYKTKVGTTHANLSYDRGLMLTLGLDTGTDLIFEIVNGNGIDEANIFEEFDRDKYKTVLGRISQDIGEYFRIGAFGYLGKEANENQESEIWMAGADATISVEPFEINLQYLERNDDNPYFALIEHDEIRTKGIIAELIFRPEGDDSTWYCVGLYNNVDSEIEELDYESGTFNIGFLLRRNIRLIGEYTYVFNENDRGEYSKFSIGLVTAF
jgi:hypothetical protein